METTEAAARWARVWHDAWQAQDTDAIVKLYAPGARFSTQVFREPHHGQEGVRRYVEDAFAEEHDPRVWVGEPIVTGDRAAVEWWAAVVENGVEITLAGVSVLRFDPAGLVLEQWDSWNQGEGLGEPPAGWGESAYRP